jgi:TRAP-type C4-dicarboxylate transport system substrate-binding protein
LTFAFKALRCLAGMARAAWPLLLLAGLGAAPARAAEAPPILLRVVGGHDGLGQYLDQEVPFWTRRVPELTAGQAVATIAPFDRSGIRGEEMLKLMRLGVVPFGTVPLGLAAANDPELNAIDLPALSPDLATLGRMVALWQPHLAAVLRERYGVELLAIYTHAAQVVFCRQPFTGLADLVGRRVRTSSVGQSELVTALRGVPVVVPFAETVVALRGGVVECAITGALAGNRIGLHQVASHVSPLSISWLVSIFGANQAAWAALPETVRTRLRDGLAQLQQEIWEKADQDSREGLACNAGLPGCLTGQRGRMQIVQENWVDGTRRTQLLAETVVPNWVERCGRDCATAWNRIAAPLVHIWAAEE